MFSRFFINRPIFATVLSILILLAGSIAYVTLPVAQYPEITPPTVEVSAVYPGANAQVVADTVAAPIEQQVNGVENMLYMSSQCTNDGTYTLTITFKLGTDLNIAQVLVQNREALAEPILPDLVKRRGVTVKKKSPSVLMIVNLFSPDNSRDSLYLSNYATIQLRDELARLRGIGDITYLGQRDYSMRLWLDPEKMAVRNLTADDVVLAIQQQNIQVAAGQIGQPPVPSGQVFQYTMTTLGRLADADQFSNMIIKTDNEGRIIRMRDIARIELGAQDYDQTCTLGSKPNLLPLGPTAVGLGATPATGPLSSIAGPLAGKGAKASVALSIYQLPGSNALDTAQSVRDRMAELKDRFPQGVDYAIVYDTTPFITESKLEVIKTLLDAIMLVAAVVLLFLQNWRSAIIPLLAVPVAIVGTFVLMKVANFSINNLTLFGLVLAIGIVVDDAIVVVEAVEHHIEHGLPPRDATIKAMEQVSGPVIAVGLVLTAVFVPCAFISGITGQFFLQFALTIAVSTVISAFNSLTLSPALSALLLRPREKGAFHGLPWLAYTLIFGALGLRFLGFSPWLEEHLTRSLEQMIGGLSSPGAAALLRLMPYAPYVVGFILGAAAGTIIGLLLRVPLTLFLQGFFRLFNVGFDRATTFYTWAVGGLLRVSLLALAVYGGLLFLTYLGFAFTPSGFIPEQDKGYLLVNVQLPDASSVGRTRQVMEHIEEIALQDEGVDHTVSISGQSLLLNARAPNFGAMYVMLKGFHERNRSDLTGPAISARLEERLQREIKEGSVNIFGAPPVEGLGTAGGFKIVIEDRGATSLDPLQGTADRVVAEASNTPGLVSVFTSFRANTPWLFLDINRFQAETMGVLMSDIFDTLQVFLGSLYVNDFNRFGRTWQVNVQGDANFRKRIEDLRQLRVRNSQAGMVPLGTFSTVRYVNGPVMVVRYNMYPAAAINANAGPGTSSGQALRMLEKIAQPELSHSMRTEWTELALLQLQTGNTAMLVFILAVVLVFLVLAAQYESWSLPLAVILVVPMCLLCSIAGVILARMDINIFTQIGFVVLVGLACKNAILIVEYAKAQHESGVPRFEATLEACKLRLRPIIMTSFAFILGVLPLVIAAGAGSEMRRTLGTAVFSGMLGVTLFGIFLTPVFYYVIQWFGDWRAERAARQRPLGEERILTVTPGE